MQIADQNQSNSNDNQSNMTYFEKFARVCIVLAINVRFLAAFSGGNSCVRWNRLGDRMEGHRNLRKIEPLMRLSLRSPLLTSSQRARKLVNTSRNSLKLKEA